MKIIYNNIIPIKGFSAINLFGTLFIRKGNSISWHRINHEEIHKVQMKELFFVLFYPLYVLEWIFRLVQYRNFRKAYLNISFEREAHTNRYNLEYLKTREKYEFIKYLK